MNNKRMNNKKFAIIVIAGSLLSTMALTGCSVGEKKSSGSNGDAPKAAAEPIKIEVIKQAAQKMPDVDFVKAELDKKLGINIKMSQEPSTDELANKLNVRAASSSLPELIEFTSKAQFEQFASKGLLLDLTPHLGKLGEVTKFLGDASFKKGTIDGNIYAIAKSPNFSRFSYWVRKDWLDKLNMKVPTTVDELFEVAKAFTDKDPDGNGKKDTFGITGKETSIFDPIFGAYGIGSSGDLLIKDGKLVNSLYDPARKDALLTIKKFLDAGVIDPEFASNKQPQANDKAYKGQAGILLHQWVIYRDNEMEQWKTANPNAEWVRIMDVKGPGGSNIGVLDEGEASAYVGISRAVEKDPAKLQKMFDLLNEVSTPEGLNLVSYGQKDIHYKMENGKPVIQPGKELDITFTWLYQLVGRSELEYLSTKFPKQAKWIEEANKLPYLKSYTRLVSLPQGYNFADADRFIKEETLKFVYGKNDIHNYDKFLKTLEGSFNYKVYMDSAEKQLKQQGVLK